MIKIGTALFEATEQLEREKGISKDVIIASLCDALVAAYKKHIRVKDAPNVEAILDETTGEIGVFRTKLVVENTNIPVIASGGAGANPGHFVEVFEKTNADAALAASIFHFGTLPVPELKTTLKNSGICIR